LAKIASHLGTFGEAVLCGKIPLFQGDDVTLKLNPLLVYQSACVKGECEHCGPERRLEAECCQHYHGNTEELVDVKWWDTTEASGKKWKMQVVLKKTTVADLFGQVCAYFKDKYIAHHYGCKVQRAMTDVCLLTMKKNHIVVHTDFAEKFKIAGQKVTTCGTAPSATLMVTLVHYYASVDDEKHSTDVWFFVSDDTKQDAPFHAHCMRMIKRYYDNMFVKVRVVVFTDGCAKQYKGSTNFMFISQFGREFEGSLMEHNCQITSHGKGVHDGLGGTAKREASHAIARGAVMNTAEHFASFLKGKFVNKTEEDYLGGWTPNVVKDYHVEYIASGNVTRVIEEREGVTGTLKCYQFIGMCSHEPAAIAADEHLKNGGLPYRVGYPVGVRAFSCYCTRCREQQYVNCLLQLVHPYTFTTITQEIITAMKEGTGGEVTKEVIYGLKVDSLKTLCRQNGLADTGLRANLRERLLTHFNFSDDMVAIDAGIAAGAARQEAGLSGASAPGVPSLLH
jgi:hypothetical protein